MPVRPASLPAALRALRRRLVPLALVLAPACMSVTPPGSSFSSEPPGARVLVDGQDSGWVTPCLIALDLERTHRVSLELEGFTPYQLELLPAYRRHVVDWYLGATVNSSSRGGGYSSIRFPFFLPYEDLFRPFRVNRALLPARVHARLHPQEAP